MGLDVVEFVMMVEDAFDLKIPDHEAETIATPGELVEYLMKRLPKEATGACLTQRAYYRIREAVVRVLGHPPAALQPETRWEELIPPKNRRGTWRLLHVAAKPMKWPRLTLRGAFPKGLSTLGDTARCLVESNPRTLREHGAGWTKAEIREVIRSLMRRQFGLDDFGWDQRFVEDLSLD